jgi:hypothetical protein
VVSTADLPPGGEGKIEVKVATNGINGSVAKAVEVFSNDPKQPQLRLTIKGTVVGPGNAPPH